jgi:hypothetical protein
MISGFKHRTSILFLGLLFFGWFIAPAYGQEGAHFEPWTTFTTQHFISKGGFWLRNDFSIRPAFDDEFNTLYMVRPMAIMDLGSYVDLNVAVDLRYTRYSESVNTIEIRTWEGVRLHWPDIGRVRFDHFYRFEQRFHWTEGFERDKIALRSRYRLNMRIPLNNTSLKDHTLFTDTRAEAFIPHGESFEETFASTLRLGLSLGYNQNNKWRYQLRAYVDWGRNTIEDEAQSNRYILEVSVRMSIQ